MLRFICGFAALVMACQCNCTASAAGSVDAFTNCLLASSSSDDAVTLTQWMFAALALNPAVSPLSAITPEQRTSINDEAVALFNRLIFEDCRAETVNALKEQGPSAINAGFEVLGQAAAGGLMSNPAVTAAIKSGLSTQTVDQAKWNQLFQDAGLPLPY